MTDKEKYKKLDDLNFNSFKLLANNTNLSKYEKIGFPDSYREGLEHFILEDISSKIQLDNEEGKIIIDIGCGCSDLVYMLIELCKKNRHTLVLVDSEEMLALIPDNDHVIKIPGYFPEIPFLFNQYQGKVDKIIVYSVLHYIFEEGNIYKFIDRSCQLLKSGGKLLLGDIPNYSKRTRFFLSEKGIETHRQFTGDSKSLPDVNPYTHDSKRIDDGVVFGILHRYRTQGFETYLLSQTENLPLANRREDILIEKR